MQRTSLAPCKWLIRTMRLSRQRWDHNAASQKVVLVGLLVALTGVSAGCGSAGGGKSVPISRFSAPRKPVHPARVDVWDPSGEGLPPAAVRGWHRVFADNFAHDDVPVGGFSGCSWPPGTNIVQLQCSGLDRYPKVAAKWFSYPDGWRGRPPVGTYFPSAVVSIRDGVMNLYVHTAIVDGRTVHLLAAMVPKIHGGSGGVGGMLYGRYVVRARFDPLPGYRVSFVLWPDSSRFPADGVIAFPDASFNAPYVNAFMHHRGATSASQQDAYRTSATLGEWHTYEIDWTPTSCAFYLDGPRIGVSRNRSLIPNTPMHLVLQTDTSSLTPAPPDNVRGNVQIDWVAVYARSR